MIKGQNEKDNGLTLEDVGSKISDLLPGVFFIVDEDGTIRMGVDCLVSLTGYSPEYIRGKPLSDLVVKHDKKRVETVIESVLKKGTQKAELSLLNKLGSPASLFIIGKKIQMAGTPHIAIQGFEISGAEIFKLGHDKGYEEGYEEADKEHVEALGKVHHRVKNDMAILTGLIDLQKSDTEDEYIHHILSKVQSRINIFGLLHESVYQAGDSNTVPIHFFITQLIEKTRIVFEWDKKKIEVNMQVDEFTLLFDKALSFGLLINELLTNAYGLGYAGLESGSEICINIQKKENRVEATLSDSNSSTKNFDVLLDSDSQGMELIRIYLKQLDAHWGISVQDEIKYRLSFECS